MSHVRKIVKEEPVEIDLEGEIIFQKEKLCVYLIINEWSEVLLKDANGDINSVFLFCGVVCYNIIGRDNSIG